MKTPLIIMTVAFTIAFLDGAFVLGLTESVYAILGLAQMGCLGWMWIVQSKN